MTQWIDTPSPHFELAIDRDGQGRLIGTFRHRRSRGIVATLVGLDMTIHVDEPTNGLLAELAEARIPYDLRLKKDANA